MSKKVMQDITSSSQGLRKTPFTRKWDYARGGDGIVGAKKSKKTAKEEVETDHDDLFSVDETEEAEHVDDPGEGDVPEVRTMYQHTNDNNDDYPEKGSNTKKYILAGAAAVIVLFFLVSNMFASATVNVELTQQSVDLKGEEFTVTKDAIDRTFELPSMSETQSRNVPAANQEEVYRKASGQIVIFNEYSSNPQRLVTNTRFQSPDGKVYRVDQAVTIPGYTMVDGEKVPGRTTVTVYADQEGEEYNIPRVDFTVPGLKGNEMYESIYARSDTEMTGGFAGIQRTAASEDIEKAEKELRASLEQSLKTQFETYLGENKILFDDAVFTRFESKALNADDSGQVTIEGKLTLYGAVFSKRDLSSYIAAEMLSSYDGAHVIDRQLDELTFAFVNKDEFDPENDDQFSFTLQGESYLVWEIDEQALRQSLAGTKLDVDELERVLKNYPSIRKADPDVSPFWKRKFPNNPDDIIIQEVSK